MYTTDPHYTVEKSPNVQKHQETLELYQFFIP